MSDTGASILAKLKNRAKEKGITYQQCLQLFFQEEFLRKLSKSDYVDNLVLKGGLFIYMLTNFESRVTIDIDFLLLRQSNTLQDVEEMIQRILAIPTGNDYITMTSNSFEKISPQRKYNGISAQIIGKIKNVRVPFNVDIGVGDVIVPKSEFRRINTQLPNFEVPKITTYSLESTIAEKFDAILQRYELTGRMKDFYDIYYLAQTFDFDGLKIQTAMYETLQNRGTPYEVDSFSRVMTLKNDLDMQTKWSYFLRTIKNDLLDFGEVMRVLQCFLEPVFSTILTECEWQKHWNAKMMKWDSKK
jgi:predicted nucleotidyltransferase component of viral defense system